MAESGETHSYSVLVRLRRTTTEAAFVTVPVTSDIIQDQGDGTGKLDPDALMKRAVAMGIGLEDEWEVETMTVAPHPTQKPPEGESEEQS